MNKIFSNFQGDVVRVDDKCYYYSNRTSTLPNTDPSEVGGVFTDCDDCLLESSSSSSFGESSSSSEVYSESSSSSSEDYSDSSSSDITPSESSSSFDPDPSTSSQSV